VPCYFSDGVFMNVELNNKIWVSEVNEKAVLKVLGTRRSLNFYEGHPYGRLPFYFLYIINVAVSAISKILCTLIYHKVLEHIEYCIFV